MIKNCEQSRKKYKQLQLKIKNSEEVKEQLEIIKLKLETNENRVKDIKKEYQKP